MSADNSTTEEKVKPALELVMDKPAASPLLEDMEIPEIGTLEELTDAIIVLFQDVEGQLNNWIVSCNEAEREELHRKMVRFLTRINSNRLLPLGFRLRALRSFSRERQLLDEDLLSAILASYKVAIHLVLEAVTKLEAGNKGEAYHLELGKLCGEAIQIAMEVVKYQLERYWEPHVQITRQVYEMVRIGLASLPKVTATFKSSSFLARINRSIAWYQMMLTADFFHLTPPEQRRILLAIEPYVANVAPVYQVKARPFISQPRHIYLVSHVSGRNIKPEYCEAVEPLCERDRVIMDITALVPILKRQLRDVQRYLEESHKKAHASGEELRTEDEIEQTLKVANHLLQSMRIKPRTHPRSAAAAQEVHIVANLNYALRMPPKASFNLVGMQERYGDESKQISTWAINDISATGLGLVTTTIPPIVPEVSSLVRIVWPDREGNFPFWAQVRWRRHTLKGRKIFMGLRFLPQKISMLWAQDPVANERVPVIAVPMKEPAELMVWINDQRYREGANILVSISGKSHLCKVLNVPWQGSNFKACRLKIEGKFG